MDQLSGRWDDKILEADEARQGLFNRIDLTVAHQADQLYLAHNLTSRAVFNRLLAPQGAKRRCPAAQALGVGSA